MLDSSIREANSLRHPEGTDKAGETGAGSERASDS